MTNVTTQPPAAATAELVARLAAHRAIGSAPREELEWLAAHGSLERYEPGWMIARKGEPVDALYIVLEGRVSHLTDQGGSWRRVLDYRAGDVAGQLPYSRLGAAPGNSVVQEPSVLLRVPREYLGEIAQACPQVTGALVHVMVDRARTFKASDLQVEKMASLGKLAAGLAHELDNPASAAIRSARLMSQALTECDDASRALGAAGLNAEELAAVERMRDACVVDAGAKGGGIGGSGSTSSTSSTRSSGSGSGSSGAGNSSALSALERADREEAFTDWLADRGVDESFAMALAETDVSVRQLGELAHPLEGDKLRAALRWVSAGCTARGLAGDIERAASRMHTLVSAVKGFTYMDHSAALEPVDVAKGITDTIAVLAAKARARSVSLSADVAADLPRVHGSGGELNQVWANLVDNAIDAVHDGGRVVVTARTEGERVVVKVTDDGAGIPADAKEKIWDPFFTTKPVGKGAGLGLDIVRRLVDRNDGLVELESEPGRTEFRVALPVGE